MARSDPRPAFGLPEVLLAVSTSRLSCKRAGKTRTLMPVWDSSAESRLETQSEALPPFYRLPDVELQKMKRLTIMLCALIGLPAYAHAAPVLKLENIKQIVCESTVSYDEDSPNEKTAARGVKIFKPGSRKDVKRRPGAFLLAEVDPDSDEQDAGYDQQFYFSPIKGGKLSFRFIADWKAHGELNLRADGTATGFINQKDHITELRCKIHRK